MKALAKDPTLQLSRGRRGPRRDHGVHPEPARLDPRADAAGVQQGGQPEHGSEAAAARRRARRARRLRRCGIDRRQDSWPLLDQPPDDEPAQQIQPRRPDLSRGHSRATSGRASTRTTCRSSGSCCPSTRTRRAGRFMRSSSPTSSAPTKAIQVGRLGYLQSLAFRACRLVVDTGLHAKRWTREQGVQFFVDVNGSNPEEVASEVDRYCSWPGQACGYKIGHTEINRQRAECDDRARPDVRRQGVQRHCRARRERAARRAGEERRRVRARGQDLMRVSPIRADVRRASSARFAAVFRRCRARAG